jgi:hypothetical protein
MQAMQDEIRAFTKSSLADTSRPVPFLEIAASFHLPILAEVICSLQCNQISRRDLLCSQWDAKIINHGPTG